MQQISSMLTIVARLARQYYIYRIPWNLKKNVEQTHACDLVYNN